MVVPKSSKNLSERKAAEIAYGPFGVSGFESLGRLRIPALISEQTHDHRLIR